MNPHVWSGRHLLELGGRAFARILAIVVGFALMMWGLAMGVSMVLLPVGIAVGLTGVLIFIWGIFGEIPSGSPKA